MIYIIEDSPLKSRKIEELLSLVMPGVPVKVLRSFQAGLKEIEKFQPILIILDMTLPTFDRVPHGREGRVRALGGYDLMKKMQHKGLRSSVVVLTQLESFGDGDEEISFAEIRHRCKQDFPEFFLECIYFEQTGCAWEVALTSIAREIFVNVD